MDRSPPAPSGPLPPLGRPSAAAAAADTSAALRDTGTASDAAFRADGGDGEWCALRAASVAGVRHRLSAEPGQDSFAWARRADRLAVAVADGVGSVPGSGPAAARAALAAVGAALTPSGPTDPAAQVAAGLSAANDAAVGGGATTAVIAVMAPDGEARLGRVGDSTAFLVTEGGVAWVELFGPPDGDGVATATEALPAAGVTPEVAAVTVGPADVLVLVTDGVADPWRDGPATVAPVLAATLAGHPSPLDLARLAGFSRQGCHDDRTLVAVWRSDQGAGPATDGPETG